MKGLADAPADLSKLLQRFKHGPQHRETPVHGEECVRGSVCSQKTSDQAKKQAKPTGTGLEPKRVTAPQEEPQAGPSGAAPEEGLVAGDVFTGGGSATPVTAPKTFQRDKRWKWH